MLALSECFFYFDEKKRKKECTSSQHYTLLIKTNFKVFKRTTHLKHTYTRTQTVIDNIIRETTTVLLAI